MLALELGGDEHAHGTQYKKKIKDESMDPNVEKTYKSRREREYEDDKSEDEDYI